MERVTDSWILQTLEMLRQNPLASADVRMLIPALEELQERRKAEKVEGCAGYRAEDKNGTGTTQECEKVVLPEPCTVGFDDWMVKDYLQKINEELDEFKSEIYILQEQNICDICRHKVRMPTNTRLRIADEAADTITAITSMLEAIGIDEGMRQAAQRRVNERNRERGRTK